MLGGCIRCASPFRCFTSEAALGPALCARLEALFAEELAWTHHRVSFYEAHLADVTDRLDASGLDALRVGVGALLDLPLAPGARVTAQRMDPGHRADPHTDRPLVGYEAARLVVQLTRGWRPGDGGIFHAFTDPTAPPVIARPPRFNQGFGFPLTPRAHHAVSPVVRPRRTAVFNFWHVANTEPLGDAVRGLFTDMRFGDLPRALDPLIAVAESTRDEEDSARAAAVAWLLGRWGRGEASVIEGYRRALAPVDGGLRGDAIGLARWLERLHRVDFDQDLWWANVPAFEAPVARAATETAALQALAFPAG